MSEVIIKINGQKLEFFDNVTLSTQIDAISSSFSFDTFFDIPNYEFAKIQVLRDNIVIFTGKVISKTDPNETGPKPFNYKCYSLTGVLEDCSLPLELYPIQTKDKTLKEIVENICNYFDVKVKIDSSAQSDANKTYSLQDQSPEDKAIDIINKLCAQRNLILSHNVNGDLLITKSIKGLQDEVPFVVSSNKSYNYRNFYKKYVILGQQGISFESARQAEATLNNIDEKRTITKIQSDDSAEITEKQAKSFRNDSYKSNSLTVLFNDVLINVGKIFLINNIKNISNSITYNYKAGSETCSVSMLNTKIYDRN